MLSYLLEYYVILGVPQALVLGGVVLAVLIACLVRVSKSGREIRRLDRELSWHKEQRKELQASATYLRERNRRLEYFAPDEIGRMQQGFRSIAEAQGECRGNVEAVEETDDEGRADEAD